MNVVLLPTESLVVPPEFQREVSAEKEDDQLLGSIRKGGVQQPLIVLRFGDEYRVLKGTRRLAAALAIGIPKVPCVIDEVPQGQDPLTYARRVRFITDEHRQDLLPSQRAEIVERLKKDMRMTNNDVAAYLGVVPDTVTNWTAPLRYIPEVREAIDAGRLTLKTARVFVGLTEKGQRHILKEHGEELGGDGPKKLIHKKLRRQYSPTAHPEFYREGHRAAKRLTDKAPQARAPRSYSADEKRQLLNNIELKESELEDGKAEAKTLRAQIEAAIPIIAAIQRNRALRDYVASHFPAMVEEFKAFGDSYI